MFEFPKWVVDNLISGVKNGAFAKEWAAVQLGNYFVKGKVNEADIARFDAETTENEAISDIPSEITEE